uniref:Uncharacterized protein n=1 Tax=Glossina austeni TaxID=7395 RepID=A0A1A9UID4_GLOAU
MSRAVYCRYVMLVCCMRDIVGHCKCLRFRRGQFNHTNNQIKCLRWACKECHQRDEDFHKLIERTQIPSVVAHSPFDETTNPRNQKSGVVGSSDNLMSANSKEVDSYVNTASVSTYLTSVPTMYSHLLQST